MALTPQQLHGIAVAGKRAQKLRSKLEPGHTYRLDFLVRIKGDLSVGTDQPNMTYTKADACELLAKVLTALGPRKCKSVVDAILCTPQTPAIDAAIEQAKRLVSETTTEKKTTKRGNVTGKITAELVEEA